MREQIDVDIADHAGTDVVHLRADELFGHARPQFQRTWQLFALHDLLHRERGRDIQRDTGVVALAMTRRTFDDRIVVSDAGLLRGLRDVVDVGAEGNHRLAVAPRRDPGSRNAGEPAFDPEAVLAEMDGRVRRRVAFWG